MILSYLAVFVSSGSKITAGSVGNATISSSGFFWKDQVIYKKMLECLFTVDNLLGISFGFLVPLTGNFLEIKRFSNVKFNFQSTCISR